MEKTAKTAQNFTLIRNGLAIDPANRLERGPLDVLLSGDKIAAVGENLGSDLPEDELEVFDASGCIVCPGLIDLHIHGFPGGSVLGIDPDQYCLKRGVTTVVDAGSAGADTFSDFRKFCENQKTNILAFLHISKVGLSKAGCSGSATGGELDHLSDVDEDLCLQCIEANRDMVVGVKLRLSTGIANSGKHEMEAYRRALSAASRASLPIMVHHTFSSVPLGSLGDTEHLSSPGSLQRGDIYTHAYHGFPSTIVDPQKTPAVIHPAVLEAKKRGVCFDIGHGQGSFSWTVAELCAKLGFWPDAISTDLHSGNIHGPAYDLATVMSRFLHLGMPLYDVVRAVTVTPATVIRKEHLIGSLSSGMQADVSVLRNVECDVLLEDCQTQMRRVKNRLVPVAVWRKGERINVEVAGSEGGEWPNKDKEYLAAQAESWEKLVVRDETL